MKKFLIIVILLTGYFATAQDIGGDYYVAVYGDDNNPGTYNAPWGTFQKAFDVARPGDTVYFRGGVYFSTTPAEIMPNDPQPVGHSGTAENPICYFNYPGETPILDCRLHCETINYTWTIYNSAIGLHEAQHIHFRGLTIRNVFQCDPVVSAAIAATSCANLTFENITIYNVSQRGYWYESGAYGTWDSNPVFEYDTVRWINCDCYNLCDTLTYGGNADGWKNIHYGNNYVFFQGCRAWNYSDDGFDCSNIDGATIVFDSCWAMSTDKYAGVFTGEDTPMEGNGFKITSMYADKGDKPLLHFTHCIASHCVGYGFYINLGLNAGYYANNARVYNNTAHKCYLGFHDLAGRAYPDSCTSVFRNNIAWDATSRSNLYDPLYEVYMAYLTIAASHNTWDVVDNSWPGWVYDDTVKVSNADFLSLDATQLTWPRKNGIYLPDITYLNLAPGSDLIDAGKDIGLPFNGRAPDIGAFESDQTPGTNKYPSVSITSPASGSSFYEPDNNIVIIADANDPDGSIAKVEFFAGSTKLGEKTSPPWSYRWNNAPAGNYYLWARATDNQNASSRSLNVFITVEPEADNLPPNVVITSPANGSKFYEPNNDFTIIADANDPDGSVIKVEFFAGSTKLGEKTSPPWSYRWNNAPAGNYYLWARATDNQNASSRSLNVFITVEPEADNLPPNVVITSPANGSKFYEPDNNIDIIANANDPDGSIKKVEFFAGLSAKLGEKTSPPWSYRWNNAPAGNYYLWARATDNENATANSSSVNVTIIPAGDDDTVIDSTNNGIGTLYPNPNNGSFTFLLNAPLEEAGDITIISLAGKVIHNDIMLPMETIKNFDLSFIQPGFYIFLLTCNRILLSNKFIKL